jgi:hypothetical protein
MKRDLDLCRDLMMAFEAVPAGQHACSISLSDKVDAVTAVMHIKLLRDAGLLEGMCYPDPDSPQGGIFAITDITWTGHDFIDSARNEGVWGKTKDRLKKAGSWTFSLMMDILKDEAKRQIGGFLG